MDSQLPNNLAQGTAILGYGEKKRSYVKYVAAFFAAIGAALLMAIIFWALLSPVSVPTGVLATISIPGKIQLPDYAPEVWRKATQPGLPVMLGVSRNGEGLRYFAVTLRWVDSGDSKTLSSGALKTFFENGTSDSTEDFSATSFFSQVLLKTRGKDAYMSLWTGAATSEKISGSIKGSKWETDFKLGDANDALSIDNDNFVNLKALPKAWEMISRSLAERFSLDLQEMPSAVGWENIDEQDFKLKFIFNEQMTDRTLHALYAAAGQSRTASYRLADGSLASELLIPDATADIERVAAIGLPLEVTLTRSNLVMNKYQPATKGPICGERQIAVVDISTIPGMAAGSPKAGIESSKLIFSADKGNLTICYQVINR
ncbi:MAG: hypothetical protein RDU25_06170 [Patescibacteria group bacterium]|nr:hypothetical protein [Patescibacteria group bacterium]